MAKRLFWFVGKILFLPFRLVGFIMFFPFRLVSKIMRLRQRSRPTIELSSVKPQLSGVKEKAPVERVRYRLLQEEAPREAVVIDGTTGEIVEEEKQVEKTSQSLVAARQFSDDLPKGLPEDIVKLAAQNKAFHQGIQALQRANLDDDLFLDAIEDLRAKYYAKH